MCMYRKHLRVNRTNYYCDCTTRDFFFLLFFISIQGIIYIHIMLIGRFNVSCLPTRKRVHAFIQWNNLYIYIVQTLNAIVFST